MPSSLASDEEKCDFYELVFNRPELMEYERCQEVFESDLQYLSYYPAFEDFDTTTCPFGNPCEPR